MDKDKEQQARRADILQRIQGLRLMDDNFMTRVLENRDCAQLVIRLVLDRPDLEVVESRTQYAIKNLQGRSVQLDIFAHDAEGKKINVEIQRDDRGAGAKRARYHASLIDANTSKPGENLENLLDTYVIFITEHDLYGKGIAVYHIDPIVRETGELFADGQHILYVNGACEDGSAVGKLMEDFRTTEPEKMHYKLLADEVSFYKRDQKGVEIMCRAFEEVRQEGRAEGRAEGDKRRARKVALTMIQAGESIEKIVAYSGLSEEEVEELLAGQGA